MSRNNSATFRTVLNAMTDVELVDREAQFHADSVAEPAYAKRVEPTLTLLAETISPAFLEAKPVPVVRRAPSNSSSITVRESLQWVRLDMEIRLLDKVE
jgi:hypothetical protein